MFLSALSCWQACLDSVTETVRQNASRWWFHIYSLLVPYISPSAVRFLYVVITIFFNISHSIDA